MILHDYWRSSAAFRVRIGLRLKGLEAGRHFVHLAKGEQHATAYRSLNPQGLVPLLEDGSLALTQSLAILEYLDETHPEPPLLPRDAEGRAWVRAVALAIACDIHPLNNLRVLQYLKRELGADDAARDRWYAHWIAEGLAPIETMLAAQPGPFCRGGSPTLADICLVPQVFNARRYRVPLDAHPRIRAVTDACLALPAFDLAQPAKQPDADPSA